MNLDAIKQALEAIHNPYSNQRFGEEKVVQGVTEEDGAIALKLQFGYPIQGIATEIGAWVEAALKDLVASDKIKLQLFQHIVAHKVQQGVSTIKNVKNIIAIASGKGGVGKSTTTANLALAMSKMGARVGVLDADIYGPSQPAMLGVAKEKPLQKNDHFVPVVANGDIQVMSIGFMVEEKEAIIWRGPMVSQALQQLLFQTAWDDLDYLFIDLPPGTGDVQLTLSQKIPVTGAVVVSTPQDIALLDAKKAISMFEKVNISIMGVVENMSMHVCSQCGHAEPIFGTGGAEALAGELRVPLLGKLPLAMPIRLAMDEGNAVSMQAKETEIAKLYQDAAIQIAISLAKKGKDFSGIMPKIVVE
ncbi:MAG: iron-sulfur cluster carrier protein ApbC [Neisseriaceae bacterium]|nr:iron-sulfur cluster carrier protein ApbC [Neisseriaceae bacterium]MBP6863099.1 iron-sulfur cluster carrier protein ApbC [Neisseriaceae bacterium]